MTVITYSFNWELKTICEQQKVVYFQKTPGDAGSI